MARVGHESNKYGKLPYFHMDICSFSCYNIDIKGKKVRNSYKQRTPYYNQERIM